MFTFVNEPTEKTLEVGKVSFQEPEVVWDASVLLNFWFLPAPRLWWKETQFSPLSDKFFTRIQAGADVNPCFIVPALPVPVNETMENPPVSSTFPELSIVPIPVALASLEKDVPAFQFHATWVWEA